MTTPSTERKAGPLLGTGAQTTWPFTFKVFAATDIAVTIADSLGVETALVYGVDYTVTLNANQETSPGGTVTYPISGSPLPVGSRLVIVGNLPYDQPLDLPSGGNFSPLALENQLDRTVMQIQQLRERVGRAVQVSITADADVILPPPAASQLIGWDSTGENLENVPLSELGTAIAYGTYRYDTFTGNGTTTNFALSEDPAALANLDVSISGVVQVPGTDYSLVNGSLVFASAPANGTTILARYGQALPSIPDSDQVSFVQAGAGAASRTVQNKLRDVVSVKDFGAVGDGLTDDTAAAQAATNTGKAVYWPAGSYRVSGVSYTGTVVWFGDGNVSRILSDTEVLTVMNGSNSQIDNLYLENITAPWIITRNPGNWAAVPTPVQSNALGYQPTANDTDIWGTLTVAQQNQDIGPKIVFDGEATGVEVSRIYGRFVSIILYNCSNSVVRDCDFRAGKNFAAGILFWNMDAAKSPGYMNRAINNVVRYPSFCGITFARNYDGLIQGNQVEYAGESGIKTYQDIVAGVQAYCYRMQVLGNFTKYSYYDGFDLQAQQALVGVIDTRHNVADNSTFGNYRTGYIMDGRNCLFVNNYSRSSGLTGMKLVIPYSLIQGNVVYEGNELNVVSGEHQMLIGGDYISITGNFTSQSVANGVGIYADGQNFVSGNKTIGAGAFLGSAGAISARTFGNQFGTAADVAMNTMSTQTRQNLTGVPAAELYSDVSSFDNVDQVFHPRKHLLANAIARIRGLLTKGSSGAENGWTQIFAAQNGVMRLGMQVQTDDTVPGLAWGVIGAPSTAVPSANMPNNSVAMYLDESGNNLKIIVKYSTGTVKTATVAVV